jgi:hypothetical protein
MPSGVYKRKKKLRLEEHHPHMMQYTEATRRLINAYNGHGIAGPLTAGWDAVDAELRRANANAAKLSPFERATATLAKLNLRELRATRVFLDNLIENQIVQETLRCRP